jgi:hypothetical protein
MIGNTVSRANNQSALELASPDESDGLPALPVPIPSSSLAASVFVMGSLERQLADHPEHPAFRIRARRRTCRTIAMVPPSLRGRNRCVGPSRHGHGANRAAFDVLYLHVIGLGLGSGNGDHRPDLQVPILLVACV